MEYSIIKTLFLTLLATLALGLPPCSAESITTDIETGLIIQPQETKAITIPADPAGASEIFWQTSTGTIKGLECQSNPCIRVYDKNIDYTTETFNYQRKFEADEKAIIIELTNIAETPVTIQIQRTVKTCSAESCAYITSTENDDWKVLRAQKINSIRTSTDGSYSHISGTTLLGKSFDEVFVWWTVDKNDTMSCTTFIQNWIDDPQSFPAPYILAGGILPQKDTNTAHIVMKVDTCTPHGENFNADDEADFDYTTPQSQQDE